MTVVELLLSSPGYDVCRLLKEPGECGNWTVRWYYKADDSRCDRFWFGQCGGNGNNFLTQEACEAACGECTFLENVRLVNQI